MIKTKQAVIVTPNFYPAVGGAETQAFLIGQELLKRNYEVIILTKRYYSYSPQQETFRGLQIRRFSGSIIKIVPNLLSPNRKEILIWNGLYKWNSFSENLLQSVISLAVKPFFIKNIFRVPCSTQQVVENFLLRTFFSRAIDRWITLNLQQCKQLQTINSLKGKIIFPPNLLIRPEVFLRKVPAQKGIPTILFYGRTMTLKGLGTLVKSLSYIPSKYPYKLIILLSLTVKYPEEIIKNLQLLNKVPFPIELKFNSAEIKTFLQKADVGIFPSSSEGGGNALREMMGASLATIASDIPVVKEVVRNGENGLLFKTTDPKNLGAKITLLLKEPKMRNTLAKNARKTAKEIGNSSVIISKILG